MGEVFRAVAVGEHGFEKPVVVKRVLSGREDLSELFVAEAKLMTRLSHPNIVEVLDFGRGEHNDYYLVLELVDGTDLGRFLRALRDRGERFPIPLALFIASQVLRGLHHAHTREAGGLGVIVHRDVSPSNVLCSAEGEVKVADFGVALVARAGKGRPGSVAGKPAYMAPEQFSPGPLDPRADVFSVGVVLYEMLAGELPFAAQGDTAELHAAARRGPSPRVCAQRPEIGESVERIVAKALALRPDDRFRDARAMAQAIEALRDEGQRIATGDDLAEHVRAVQKHLAPSGRPVVPLSRRPAPQTEAPGTEAEHPHAQEAEGDPEPDEDAVRELTRSQVGEAFTLRFPSANDALTESERASHVPDRWSAPEPRTERIDPPSEPLAESEPAMATAMALRGLAPRSTPAPGPPTALEAPRSTPGARVAVAVVAALCAVGAAAVSLHSPAPPVPRAGGAATSSTTPPPTAELEPPAASSAPLEPPPLASAVAVSSARVRPLSARPTATPTATNAAAPAPAPSVTVVSVPAAAASKASAATACRGEVAFYSNESWTIQGGPSAVQTPRDGIEWPCGTYGLTARSRFDASQVRAVSVTVRPDQRAVVDLR
jgi:serine/threonine protein kinase